MKSGAIPVFFALVFTLFLITPTVLTLMGEPVDVALFSSNEEESEQENELRKLLEVDLFTAFSNQQASHDNKKDLKSNYYTLSFEELHLESIYPPPEQA